LGAIGTLQDRPVVQSAWVRTGASRGPRFAIRLLLALAAAILVVPARSAPAAAPAPDSGGFRADALAIETIVDAQYAYLERFPGARMPMTDRLRAEAAAVRDRDSLLRYAERAMLMLADHHAITGSSFPDSWAIIPSYADLWIERSNGRYIVDAVRDGSPAAAAGIGAGDVLVAVDGVAIAQAVTAFWADLGADPTGDRAVFAARILAAGRRDHPRRLTVQRGSGPPRSLSLPNLYAAARAGLPFVTTRAQRGALVIRLEDSLGSHETIAAFDAAMARARPRQRVILDLTGTPSGGDTVVARAILGWFVDRPRGYQIHNLPSQLRETGIARQWIEQVLPRPGKHHDGTVIVRVGRWTGSMGEGIAIGFHAIGARVIGSRMAGLRGAVYDQRLDHSGLILKLPSERLTTVDGVPREDFVPEPAR
jgi:hypothetical protein